MTDAEHLAELRLSQKEVKIQLTANNGLSKRIVQLSAQIKTLDQMLKLTKERGEQRQEALHKKIAEVFNYSQVSFGHIEDPVKRKALLKGLQLTRGPVVT